ncbi:MAG: T9SS type A sorting domain-containing protein [Bacteroidales bacterium]
MKTKILLTFIFAVSMQFCFGQINFENTYGGIHRDIGYSVQQTNDNGYIITGVTKSFGDSTSDNVYLIKTDENGDTLWTKTFGDINDDCGFSVLQTNDNGYIVVGSNRISIDTVYMYIIKTDINGDTLWTKTLTSRYNFGYSVQQTNDNGYIIVGETKDNYNYGCESDVYIVKINENGDTLWTRTYGGPYEGTLNNDIGQFVLQTNDNGFIIAGGTEKWGYSGWKNIYLIRTDINGDTLWTKTYGETCEVCENWAFSMTKTNDSGYVICGYIQNYDTYGKDVYIMKIDSIGNQQWYKTYGGIYDDVGRSIYKTNDNGYIITGYTESFGVGNCDVYLIKTDINGDILWARTYGGAENDVGYSVQQTNDNGYIISGSTRSFGDGSSDVYLIKTDENGNIEFINNFNKKISLDIFPNPNNGTFTIQLDEAHSNVSIYVYDLNGRIVYSKNGLFDQLNTEIIKLPDVSDGLYYLHLSSENINAFEKIIIKK